MQVTIGYGDEGGHQRTEQEVLTPLRRTTTSCVAMSSGAVVLAPPHRRHAGGYDLAAGGARRCAGHARARRGEAHARVAGADASEPRCLVAERSVATSLATWPSRVPAPQRDPLRTASLRSRDRPNVAVAGLARGTELPISGSSGRNPRRTRVGVSRAVGSVLSVREQEARRPVGPLSDIPDSRSLSLQPVANCRPSGLNATAHTTWVIPRPSWWTSRSCSWPRAAHGRRPRPAPSLARQTREARSGDQSPGRAGGAWFIRLWCPVPGRAPMEVDSRRSRRRRERDQRGSRRTGPRR
jgi:hypothetical protein